MRFDETGIPYYYHIESLIRNKILSGQLEPGERLLKEQDLAAQFGVSQITIRTALSHLEAEKLIVRRSGKGTFVAEAVPTRKQTIVTRDLGHFVRDSAKYQPKTLRLENRKVGETRLARDLRRFFGVSNSDLVCVVHRVRLLGKIPVIFVENFLSPEIGKHLTAKDLSQRPLQTILKEKIGLKVGRNDSYLESVPAEHDISEMLEINVFSPLFLLQSHLWFSSGEPFEIVNNYMRPDFFKFKIQVSDDSSSSQRRSELAAT